MMIPPDLQKIDGSAFGKAIEQDLGIKGLRVTPPAVDMSHVACTYDLSTLDPARGPLGGSGGIAINGVSLLNVPLIGPRGWTVSTRTPLIPTDEENARVRGIFVDLVFDAAGSAAFNGKVVWFYLHFVPSPFTTTCPFFYASQTIATGRNSYFQNNMQPAMWRGSLPWYWGLQGTVLSQDGTVFPANTTIEWRIAAGCKKRGVAITE